MPAQDNSDVKIRSVKFIEWYKQELSDTFISTNFPQNRMNADKSYANNCIITCENSVNLSSESASTRSVDRIKCSIEDKELDSIIRPIVEACNTMEALREAIMNFDGCDLKKTATNTVISDGNQGSGIMLIGEAPGAEEDKQGIPFCGQSGKLLDNILKSVGLNRNSVYISNTVFWRPPANRRPTQLEIKTCRPFIERHIYLVNPNLIILVGSTAVEALLQNTDPITSLRKQKFRYTNRYLGNHSIPITIIFHPSYLLRQPLQKKKMWFDMLEIKHEFLSLTRFSAKRNF